MQLTFEGLTLDELAIGLIQAYEPPDGYYLGFSGGKDSVVIYDLTKRAGVKCDYHYNVSPIDPPQIHSFIKEYYPDVQWDYLARGFFGKKFLSEGPPMQQSRWCCKFIKEAGGQGRIKILGMRRAESTGRRKYTCFQEIDSMRRWLLPIVHWSNSAVWQYISERSLKVCSLYSEGFTRIGCILCPYTSRENTKLQITKFPKIASVWRRACDRYFQVRIERGTPLPYKSPEEFWQWWISRK